ncbi:VWA domain-containing protein [Hyphobacterium sp. CCMP332]|nr:VWA domain-containing protein [Hyphobacterium sp. CCMP332]
MKYLYNLIITVVIALFLISCGGNDTEDPGPPENPSVHKPSYYNHELTPPNKVNVIFQLSDDGSVPLPGLLPQDVMVMEDGESLNSEEYNFSMASEFDYEFSPYVTLLIDVNLDNETILTDLIEAGKAVIGELPAGSSVQVYTYSVDVSGYSGFDTDLAAVAANLDNIELGDEGSNLLEAVEFGMNALKDSLTFGANRLAPGFVIAIAANADTEGRSSVEDINEISENIRLYSLSLGTAADSSLQDIVNRRGFVALDPAEFDAKISEIGAQIDLLESSFYVFNYESDKEGSEEVNVTMSTARSEAEDNIIFTYEPGLFFNPDSFEIKTDILRVVLTGESRNGSVIVRKDIRNDSVDFQLFSGFNASDYDIIFTDKDPAIFNDWVNLNNDPDKIKIRINSSEFVLDEGFQSTYLESEIWDKKYMVIRDDRNRKDLSYIQMTLQ